MADDAERIREFVEYALTLKGDEKGEAQVFCDRLFQAFGHAGYKEAGATLEQRVRRKGHHTRFVDLVWRPRLLLEMKSRGEKLHRHYRQAFEYWLDLVPNRPRYVILCNFDEFWVYDFDLQLEDPVDRLLLTDLPDRFPVLNFLFPEEKKPLFGNDLVAVSRAAADKVAHVFNAVVGRGEDRERAQRFILQSVVAMFSEDISLLPRGLFIELLNDCKNGASSYDVLGGLFTQMNSAEPARGGCFKGVPYFNGGIFGTIEPIELNEVEVELLVEAASENWSKVQPPVFGTLFQSSMDKEDRHAYGAHFTSEADIQKIVLPTIVRPWRSRLEKAKTLAELLALRGELLEFHVLDPACGSGNFLYVAFRELKRVEMEILAKIHGNFGRRAVKKAGTTSLVNVHQFHGIDMIPFAAELAKVTLMIGKKLAMDETSSLLDAGQFDFPFEFEKALPLDNLDDNIYCNDALFCEWPKVQAIIGNPPYQSKNKMQQEFGLEYVKRVRAQYPAVSGRADYCVYWFRRAHQELPPNGRAGLVGTNTVSQTYSREGGLDYIVENGGTITEAVSSQVWSGEAVVHVSVVNWLKGEEAGKKKLYQQLGDNRDSPWNVVELETINSALSAEIDVTSANALRVNLGSRACYQGQTHGHEGFLLASTEVEPFLNDASSQPVIHPYLTGDDILGNADSRPSRYAIDLNHCPDLLAAMRHTRAYERVEQRVLPTMEAKASKERKDTGKDTGPRQSHFQHWWKYWRGRPEMIERLGTIPRYVACSRVTKRPIFVFVSSEIHPNDALQVFALCDDYSFGILQSDAHWQWFTARCSTLKGDFRYTSNTVFDTFPWPQTPTLRQIVDVAEAGRNVRSLRQAVMNRNKWDLRTLYRTLELPGEHPLRRAHQALDNAARDVYGMGQDEDALSFLLDLNHEIARAEDGLKQVIGPGLPDVAIARSKDFITSDCTTLAD